MVRVRVMFIPAVCVLFLIKLRWPKKTSNLRLFLPELYNTEDAVDFC